MKYDLHDIGYYLVTDRGLSRKGVLSDVEKAVAAGCRIVQYREKHLGTRDMVSEAAAIAEICRSRAVFLVNDRVDVALAGGADGVHLGQDDLPYEAARSILGPDAVIGITTHNVEESLTAESQGADYIGLSPIFSTTTKEDAGAGCGLDMVRQVRKALQIPIVTIGGISLSNAGDVIRAGADSVAAISAVVATDDVRQATAQFIAVIAAARGGR
jgi:thiamine-phosphate pyrophosphorylase